MTLVIPEKKSPPSLPLLRHDAVVAIAKAVPRLFIQSRDTAAFYWSHLNPGQGFAVPVNTVGVPLASLDKLPRWKTYPGHVYVIHKPDKLVWIERVRFFRKEKDALDFAVALEDTLVWDLATGDESMIYAPQKENNE